jgi:N-acetyl-gamma-glutamyl-phosphate reductase
MSHQNRKIRVGIIGAAGYTGGELIRLLLLHPHVVIDYAHSRSQSNKAIHTIHTDLLGETDLCFTDGFHFEIDVLFMCSGHGMTIEFLNSFDPPDSLRIIDLSADFRLASDPWIYGLPELNRDAIKHGIYNIANPGCFATCIELALLPIANFKSLPGSVHISATTGSTGAGQSPQPATQFSWRSNNLSAYKAFEHQHLAEIKKSLTQLQGKSIPEINFIPHRGSFTRGIFASLYMETSLTQKDAFELFSGYYASHPFVSISEQPIDLKQVVNTNKCVIHIERIGTKLFINSILDNLLKGASGQAVQNMNLIFGFDETAGLKLKASVY